MTVQSQSQYYKTMITIVIYDDNLSQDCKLQLQHHQYVMTQFAAYLMMVIYNCKTFIVQVTELISHQTYQTSDISPWHQSHCYRVITQSQNPRAIAATELHPQSHSKSFKRAIARAFAVVLAFTPMYVERKVHYSSLFTYLVRWHVSAVSFPQVM